jgi:hypothetical protein
MAKDPFKTTTLPFSALDCFYVRFTLIARQPTSAAGALAPRLFERGADVVEYGADLRADGLDGDDDEHGNQTGDQRIFNRRHAGFIVEKVTDSKHGILLTLYGSLRS